MKQARTAHSRPLAARGIAIAVAAVSLLVFVPASPASAYMYASGGNTGGASTVRGSCNYMRTNVSGWLRMITNPPTVTGVNLTYGTDFTWVRYRAYLVNVNTGSSVYATGWSGWLQARDDTAATWSGYTTLDGDWNGNWTVDYRIEWWNSTRMLGWQAHRIRPYNYYDQRIGPYGPISTCYKYI